MADTTKYPWLCSSTDAFQDGDSDSSAGGLVTEGEANNAEAITTDAYGKYGLKLTYYKVSLNTEKDQLYGEDTLQKIERAFYINGYVDQLPPNVLTYQLQGIWGEDTITMYVGRTAFKYWSTYGGADKNSPEVFDDFEPRIGDVIYFEQNDTFYEIRDVKFYSNAFGLASHTYTITLKVYKDIKLTIDTTNETLSDVNDPIYKVASSNIRQDKPIDDPLAINRPLEQIQNVLWSDDESGRYRHDPFDGW